jgi:hypothetical protein
MMSDFEVAMGDSASPSDFYVKFNAPKDSQSKGEESGAREAKPEANAALYCNRIRNAFESRFST